MSWKISNSYYKPNFTFLQILTIEPERMSERFFKHITLVLFTCFLDSLLMIKEDIVIKCTSFALKVYLLQICTSFRTLNFYLPAV